MSRPSNRRPQPGGLRPDVLMWSVLAGIVLLVAAVIYAGVKWGHAWAGLPRTTPNDPFELGKQLAQGEVAWPVHSTWVVVIAALGLLLAAILAGMVWQQTRNRGSRVDSSAAVLGRGRDIINLTEKSTKEAAQRLTIDAQRCGPGIPIGRAVPSGQMLYGSWEDIHIDVWGPRTGKTTSRAIPALLAAPGAAIATSNKRDLLDATRDVRAKKGRVWVFDPQGVAGESASWWWNPLDTVTDERSAAELAEHFGSAGRSLDAKTDAYFDPAAETLLANLFLAAAVTQRPITDCWTWLSRPTDEEPADILTQHGFPLKGEELRATMQTPDKQKQGIYGTARQMASTLTHKSIARWVTRSGRHELRPKFDAKAFARSNDTLYELSREGAGNASALVTALTAATTHAAETYASASAGGRLPIPMVICLDETGNVVRWKRLPEYASFFGSKGLVLLSIFQSWSQGVRCFTEPGMRALWSASNVKVFGGGVSEGPFLEELSKLAGDYDKETRSVNYGHGRRSVSHQLQRERILTVGDLASMPPGRALVLASGSRPTLVKTVPWMDGKHAKAVRASIKAHDPAPAS